MTGILKYSTNNLTIKTSLLLVRRFVYKKSTMRPLLAGWFFRGKIKEEENEIHAQI